MKSGRTRPCNPLCENRDTKYNASLENSVKIASLFLLAEKVPDGIIQIDSNQTKEYLQMRYHISDEDYTSLQSDLATATKMVD